MYTRVGPPCPDLDDRNVLMRVPYTLFTCRQRHGYAKTDICAWQHIKDSVTRVDCRVSCAHKKVSASSVLATARAPVVALVPTGEASPHPTPSRGKMQDYTGVAHVPCYRTLPPATFSAALFPHLALTRHAVSPTVCGGPPYIYCDCRSCRTMPLYSCMNARASLLS